MNKYKCVFCKRLIKSKGIKYCSESCGQQAWNDINNEKTKKNNDRFKEIYLGFPNFDGYSIKSNDYSKSLLREDREEFEQKLEEKYIND